MKISSESWHYKIYRWMEQDGPSVCKYWAVIVLAFPICSVFAACILLVASPVLLISWVTKKTGLSSRIKSWKSWFAHRVFCPFGKIEIEYPPATLTRVNRDGTTTKLD